MPSAASLVPQKGPVALFANSANRTVQGFSLLEINGKPRIVEVVTPSTERARYSGLLSWIGERDLYFHSIDTSERLSPSKRCAAELRSADAVIIPSALPGSKTEEALYQSFLGPVRQGTALIHPISMRNMAGVFNYNYFYGSGAMQAQYEAVLSCASQIARVDFAQILFNAAKSLGFELQTKRDPNFAFAERFQLRYMMPGGNWELPNRELNEASGLLQNGGLKGNIFFASPHADDLVIAAGAFVASLTAKGWNCLDLVFASGQGGVTADFILKNKEQLLGSLPARSAERQLLLNNYYILETLPPGSEESKAAERFIKTFVRMSELAETDKPLGAVPELLNLPFYDNRNPDGSRVILPFEYDLVRTALAHNFDRVDMVFAPLKGDMHPDHVATRTIALKIAAGLAVEQGSPIPVFSYASPWFTGATPINALLYYQPQSGFSKQYPAVKSFGRALAIAGTELSCGFAAAPPALGAYCGGDTDRIIAEGFNISVKQ